jgi:CheY-like chemotaxis protein
MAPPVDILLVEDDPADVELTLRSLRRNGLANSIHVVHDGAEALEYLIGTDDKGPLGRPKCVLLDLKLPKVGGLEVLRQIKQMPELRTIPVIVLTSSREAPDLKTAYELGVNSYLCKPVTFKDFAEMIRQIGYYWLLTNVSPD